MRTFKNKSQINILSVPLTVVFEKRKFVKPAVVKDADKLRVFQSELVNDSHKKILMNWLHERAKRYLVRRTEALANKHGFNYNKIAVKNQKTRWGSCSSKKNLNFNWRLYLTPRGCADYVIIHELAHTKELNHSKPFWKVVENAMPNYQEWDKWLNENGRYLF